MLPAYAGMILPVGELAFVAVGAPRVCGDDPDACHGEIQVGGVLPAYAGMIPAALIAPAIAGRAPRVCGDDPVEPVDGHVDVPCSPRMRG